MHGEAIPVMITVRGRQFYDGAEGDEVELMTEGVLERTETGLRLAYQESALTGMEGTRTTFDIEPGRVILRRSGSVSSQMVFQEGRQHTSLYETPVGELSVDIRTRRLRQSITEQGGTMDIGYSIAVENTLTGTNRFQLWVRRR